MGSSTLEWVGTAAFGVSVGGFLAGSWVRMVKRGADRERLVLRARRRSRRAMTVATDASLDQEAFDPQEIRRVADEILAVATTIWAGTAPKPKHAETASPIERWARAVATDMGGKRV